MWGYTSYQPYAVPCYTPRATYAEAQHWYQTEPLYQQCVEPPRRQGTTQHQRLPARHRTDPADYGWHFQGSNEASRVDYLARVEENGTDVKMDYYPTSESQAGRHVSAACSPLMLCQHPTAAPVRPRCLQPAR